MHTKNEFTARDTLREGQRSGSVPPLTFFCSIFAEREREPVRHTTQDMYICAAAAAAAALSERAIRSSAL